MLRLLPFLPLAPFARVYWDGKLAYYYMVTGLDWLLASLLFVVCPYYYRAAPSCWLLRVVGLMDTTVLFCFALDTVHYSFTYLTWNNVENVYVGIYRC